jgi:hypothetical protein
LFKKFHNIHTIFYRNSVGSPLKIPWKFQTRKFLAKKVSSVPKFTKCSNLLYQRFQATCSILGTARLFNFLERRHLTLLDILTIYRTLLHMHSFSYYIRHCCTLSHHLLSLLFTFITSVKSSTEQDYKTYKVNNKNNVHIFSWFGSPSLRQ